jgi:prepilin-type N-terminal cleavage/methylation domain-containing protein
MTLMEVMIAIAIIAVISTLGWASLNDAIELNQVLAINDDTTRGARVSLDRLRRELQLAYLTPHRVGNVQVDPNDPWAALAAGGNGVQPNANDPVVVGDPTYVTVFVGEDGDPDTLWFATLAHQRLYKNSRECDQAEVTVWGERARKGQGVGSVLYHRESPRIDGEPDEEGRIWPLAYNVRSFNLRYLDHITYEWYDEWDTRSSDTPYRLPRAVQIGLVLLAPDPDDEDRTVEMPYLTTVALSYAEPVLPKFGSDLLNQAGMGAAAGAGGNPFGGAGGGNPFGGGGGNPFGGGGGNPFGGGGAANPFGGGTAFGGSR